MSNYFATITWSRNGQTFTDNRYKRAHLWHFDGEETIRASSSPHVVPSPLSDPSAVDPEEAFVASISSCHMLWFLSIAAKRGFVIENYEDKAEGLMEKDNNGRLAFTQVTLCPRVIYQNGSSPSVEEDAEMHRQAHEECFIANSVKTKIKVESNMSNTPAE
jgi:organic hydroperoxide reductase OsmC/OhrA